MSPRATSLIVAACLLLAAPARAQWIDLGVKGGVDLANQHVTGSGAGPGPQLRLGLVAGVVETLAICSWLDVQAEGLYAVKGSRATVNNLTTTVDLEYLEVPVLARVRRGAGKFRYFVVAGPSTAFRLRARTRTSFNGSTEELDISDQVERLDFGVAMGGGIEIGRVVVDGRYTFGVRDIDKDKTDATKTTNRTITISLGYRLRR